jgi:hypothetical protein
MLALYLDCGLDMEMKVRCRRLCQQCTDVIWLCSKLAEEYDITSSRRQRGIGG